jgi:threonine dehydrogenase-like Zn-dependent dehydrogenase
MRALTLNATWEPRFAYKVTPTELETRKAINANTIWKDPKLEFSEKPIPRVEEDEVLIKVKACGVCGSDTHCYEKDEQGYILFSGLLRLPVILGHEFSGEVIEVGKKVSTLKVGDAVAMESIMWCGICTSCRTGNLNQCQRLEMVGFSAPGAFAEYIAVKEKYCWKLDALRNIFHSDDEVYDIGALIEPIGCAYNGMFISENGFKPGAYVAVYGAGPIGLGAVLIARAAGAARIFVFDISEPRNQLALALEADYAASPTALKRKGTSPSEVVLEMTGGYGVDMQIEAAGAASATVPEILKSFASNGKMVFLGRQDSYTQIQFDTLVTQANHIVGSRGHAGYGIYKNVIRLIATGRVPAHKMITSRFPFERVIDAVAQSAARNEGKIMVRFS